MAKLEGKRKKWIFVVLVLIILIATGVTLAITYWPAKVKDIEGNIIKHLEQNFLEAPVYQKSEAYFDNHLQSFADNDDIEYYNEAFSYLPVLQGVSNALEFYSNKFDLILREGVDRKKIKSFESAINSASKNYEKIYKYLSSHESEMESYEVVYRAWETIRIEYNNLLNNYELAFENLTEICKGQQLRGVYGNEFMVLGLEVSKNYLQVIREKFFGNENQINSEHGVDLAKDFGNFSIFLSSHILRNYYINPDYQEFARDLSLLEEKTDFVVSFDSLIRENFEVDVGFFTLDQNLYINKAIKFLQGGGI